MVADAVRRGRSGHIRVGIGSVPGARVSITIDSPRDRSDSFARLIT
jgi:hypothetical protein